MGSALVGNGNASTISILDPSVGADEADLVVPVPGSATKVGGVHVVGGREDALSVVKVITLEASGTISIFGMRSTVVRDRHADFISVEDPLFRAGEADLVVPVPGGASRVSGFHVIRGREDASSVDEVVSLEAGEAVTVLGVSGALVSNGNTSAVGILEPVLGASKADLIFPVPSGTSEVGRSGVVGGREDASSVDEVVSLEAGSAISVLCMSGALIRDSGADSVSILDPSVRADEADLSTPVPGSTSEIDGFHVVRG